jgi:hypothetical protein
MKRASQLAPVGCILLCVAGSAFAQKNPKPPKTPPPPPAAHAPAPQPHPAAANQAAANQGNKNPQAPKTGPRLAPPNPNNPVELLMAMPPEKRERFLEKLPAKQQANLRERLDNFAKLPAAERERRNQLLSTFTSLPPEKQALVSHQMQAFNELPEDRRQVIIPALQRLRSLPEDQREALLNREQFRARFSPTELQMMTDISQNYPLPPKQTLQEK